MAAGVFGEGEEAEEGNGRIGECERRNVQKIKGNLRSADLNLSRLMEETLLALCMRRCGSTTYYAVVCNKLKIVGIPCLSHLRKTLLRSKASTFQVAVFSL
ncbi:hypothetical protein RRG08_025928 [Elysia crispata]|uniref:Uncharacterized protein n=1 Tax=Elysia crispata TaxID=231223 RepID=A0AAE0ZYM8_9GAST|nr:hypothetical protein RRG08_025928 [Elysia crispata]